MCAMNLPAVLFHACRHRNRTRTVMERRCERAQLVKTRLKLAIFVACVALMGILSFAADNNSQASPGAPLPESPANTTSEHAQSAAAPHEQEEHGLPQQALEVAR